MLAVLAENEALVAADKPAGMLAVPSVRGRADTRPCLGPLLEAQVGCRLWPVHRLDLEVSGLALFAKNADAHRLASRAFEGRRVRKVYEALTEGAAPTARAFRWRSRLVRGKKRAFAAPHGKLAVTRAWIVGREPAARWCDAAAAAADLLRWRIEPQTGRPHQIRVHLAAAGFPVAGDALYGSRLALRGGGIALRAVEIAFLDEADACALGLSGTIAAPPLGPAP